MPMRRVTISAVAVVFLTGSPPLAAAQSAPTITEALDLGDCPDTAAGLEIGKGYACTCTSNAEQGVIYGTILYSNDSYICTAAIHTGLIANDMAGKIIVQVIESPTVFRGTTQNGIKSTVWPKPTASAFRLTKVP